MGIYLLSSFTKNKENHKYRYCNLTAVLKKDKCFKFKVHAASEGQPWAAPTPGRPSSTWPVQDKARR